MEQVNFGYSMKNISVPGKQEYLLRLTHSVSKFVNDLRWRTTIHLSKKNNAKITETAKKETFGFKSLTPAPPVDQLKDMEEKLIDLVGNIETKHVKNEFQDKLKQDSDKIRNDKKLFIAADKTTNYYKLDKETHKTLLDKHVTKDYKKKSVDDNNDKTEEKAQEIVTKLELKERVFATSKKEATITLKDHKETFQNDPTCRLINPTKTELGKISKQKLSKIVTDVKTKTDINQWKNTDSVLSWFSNLENKQKLVFINFDIDSFYPNISETLLVGALNWASTITTITEEDRTIILHCRESLLCSGGVDWVKRGDTRFDVAMGSFDGAEASDIVGLYLLHQMEHLPINIGLYRDDGLAVSALTKRQTEIVRQQIVEIFKKNGLKIHIVANIETVNFLDVTLNLKTGKFCPYKKPNSTPMYIHTKSNHPPTVIRNIPMAVNRRLCKISSGEEEFRAAAGPYQDALDAAGYEHKLEYTKPETQPPRRQKRGRKITWFNPPFSVSISTNVGQRFLRILDESFPPGHELHSLLNRNTVKVSYRTMPNMAQAIAQHNAKVSSTRPAEVAAGCNCRGGVATCPMEGNCLVRSVVYGATVTDTAVGKQETYTGLTGAEFKTRYGGHKGSFKNRRTPQPTTLSGHVWRLKDAGRPHTIQWRVLCRAPTYNVTTGMCRLCLKEKYLIMFSPETALLNSRRELFSSCRHRKAKLLCSF